MTKMNYEVIGKGGQEFIEVTLKPGETVISEAGAMIYMDGDIKFEAKMGDGSNPDAGLMDSLFSVGKRLLAGESAAMAHYTNTNKLKERVVAMASPYPGTIVGLDLEDVGGVFYCERGTYLASSLGTEISLATTGSVSSTFLGGEGLFMQKIIGNDTLILHSGGTIHQRDLAPGEELIVDEGCLVGYTQGIEFETRLASKKVGTILFGGEGLCLNVLKGIGSGGTVLLQNLPLERFAQALAPHIGSGGSRNRGSVTINN